jgi:hypothetical protein
MSIIKVDVLRLEDVEQIRDRVRAALNPLRDTFLSRLSGIAIFAQDEAIREECSVLRTALLDITKDPTFLVAETYEDMRESLITRFKVIASGASDTVRNVFRELEF